MTCRSSGTRLWHCGRPHAAHLRSEPSDLFDSLLLPLSRNEFLQILQAHSTFAGFLIGMVLSDWWFEPWKIWKSLGWLFYISGKIRNVPNHQPAMVVFSKCGVARGQGIQGPYWRDNANRSGLDQAVDDWKRHPTQRNIGSAPIILRVRKVGHVTTLSRTHWHPKQYMYCMLFYATLSRWYRDTTFVGNHTYSVQCLHFFKYMKVFFW